MTDRPKSESSTDIPTFALTFDTELIWGSFDHTPPEQFERTYPDIRGTIKAILTLLDEYDVPATWAVVGHLFLDECRRDPTGVAHPQIVRPGQSAWDGDWYSEDPCTSLDLDPLWYGTDILDAIQEAEVSHEIACHSFGHAVYGDAAFSREAADADLEACIEAARQRGLVLKSFVFPRNTEGHHEALREHGFLAYRGSVGEPRGRVPRPLRRARRYVEQFAAAAPPVARPTEFLPGLWNIPASMLLMHRTGARRLLTRFARARRARAGLARARSTRGVFHVWTHPFNLAHDRQFMLDVLEDVLVEAVRARDQGLLTIETMASIAERLAAAGDRSSRSR